MIPAHFLMVLPNYVWQSTAAAVLIGILALALRRNPARIRQRLWKQVAQNLDCIRKYYRHCRMKWNWYREFPAENPRDPNQLPISGRRSTTAM
jgi:hypothetical protein